MDPTCSYYCYKNNRNANSEKVGKGEKIQLVVFDMDGVLSDIISSWKHIHDYFGTSNEQSVDEPDRYMYMLHIQYIQGHHIALLV